MKAVTWYFTAQRSGSRSNSSWLCSSSGPTYPMQWDQLARMYLHGVTQVLPPSTSGWQHVRRLLSLPPSHHTHQPWGVGPKWSQYCSRPMTRTYVGWWETKDQAGIDGTCSWHSTLEHGCLFLLLPHHLSCEVPYNTFHHVWHSQTPLFLTITYISVNILLKVTGRTLLYIPYLWDNTDLF